MKNIYKPEKVIIKKIEQHAFNVKLFRLIKKQGRFAVNEKRLTFIPGQFVLAGLLGYGEAPFGISSSPFEESYIDIVVRQAGTVTNALHLLKEGQTMTVRGPYGRGWPVDFLEGKDIVMATGGCGIPPIAALIEYLIKRRRLFNKVYLIYGAKTPQDLLMMNKIKIWKNDIEVFLTVDQPDKDWTGYVGMVSELIKEIKVNSSNAVVCMCGPGPMMEALEKLLRPMGISDRRIFVNVERKMQCGIGKCQHCICGDKYVCLDGPVFNMDQIDKSWD